jgi:hypothetical protein
MSTVVTSANYCILKGGSKRIVGPRITLVMPKEGPSQVRKFEIYATCMTTTSLLFQDNNVPGTAGATVV